MVMVDNICAVEKLDYGALGKSNMGQIIHKTSDESTAIIYFQAKVWFTFVCLVVKNYFIWVTSPIQFYSYLNKYKTNNISLEQENKNCRERLNTWQ